MMGKKEKTLTVILSTIVMLILATVTYGFFSAGVTNENKQEASITTGDMKLTFADGSPTFSAAELTPGASVTKTFTIENTGSKVATARLKWKDLINSYLPVSLSYKLEYSLTDGKDYKIIDLGNVPQSLTKKTEILYENIYVPANTKLYYNLTITLENLEDIDQTADLNASMSSYFELEATHYDALMATDYDPSTFFGGKESRAGYEAVYTVDHINIPNEASYSWDVSYLQNGSVMAWDMDNDEDGNLELYIGQNGGVIANPNSHILFEYFENVTEMDLSNLDTSKVWDMSYMFSELWSLTKLDLSSFDTSNVTNMSGMFYDSLIGELNFNGWDTSKVINMECIFEYVSTKNLDLSSWDMSNVTSHQYMFSESGVESITINQKSESFIMERLDEVGISPTINVIL